MCLLSFHDQAHGNPLELLPQNGNIRSTFHSFPINNAACLLRYMGYHVICNSLLRNIFQLHKYNTEDFFLSQWPIYARYVLLFFCISVSKCKSEKIHSPLCWKRTSYRSDEYKNNIFCSLFLELVKLFFSFGN